MSTLPTPPPLSIRRWRNVEKSWQTGDCRLLELWLLRILVPLGGHRTFIEDGGFDDNKIARMLGFQKIPAERRKWDMREKDFDRKTARRELFALHEKYEQHHHTANPPGHLPQNVHLLAERVGLSQTDRRILEFAICLHNDKHLEKAADYLGQLSSTDVFSVLSVLLGLPEEQIRVSLQTGGLLDKSGLVRIDRGGTRDLHGKLDLLSSEFADDMMISCTDPVALLRHSFFLSTAPHLCVDDYRHLPELKILRLYLKAALGEARRGVNIFLYGRPGTGKTQLAKVLAANLKCELYEIAGERHENSGNLISSENRLNALQLAHHFFANRKVMILFDEADDVFDGGGGHSFSWFFTKKSHALAHKSATNRLLEENPLITLWLANSVGALDKAFSRRFDMLVELPIPPRRQRRKIICESSRNLIDGEVIERLSDAEELAPAVVTRVASVVDAIQGEVSRDEAAAAFELLINNTLKAQGSKTVPANDPNRLPKIYSPAFINSDADMRKVAAGLKKSPRGRLCLYGPPGTGKTAWGRWLAEQLQRPLLVKRGSDLRSKWVGGTEKNIAAAFRQAVSEEALLLIDEMDGFLQDRRRAARNWEVTEVNEMLTQIESFAGIFIASTNLLDNLDQAALRRFDLKLKFDFLKPEQTAKLLGRYCKELQLRPPGRKQTAAVKRLANATPGDFAAISRRHRFHPIRSAEELAGALADECGLKEGAARLVGFV